MKPCSPTSRSETSVFGAKFCRGASSGFCHGKGAFPVVISNTKQPNAHQSTDFPYLCPSDHLWGHVPPSVPQIVCMCSFFPLPTLSSLRGLGEAKVGDPNVPLGVQKDILGLQVPVDDANAMKVLDRQRDFGGIKGPPPSQKMPGSPAWENKSPPIKVLHHKVHFDLVWNVARSFTQERVHDLGQGVPLFNCACDSRLVVKKLFDVIFKA